MKRLPLGIQTFEHLAEEDYLYVDKTAAIHELVTTAGRVVFLSRPRRFGKSLLCSTLASMFEGRRKLFSGLALDGLPWTWTEYPVIRIDLNAANYMNGIPALAECIHTSLNSVSRKYQVELTGESSSAKLANLIEQLHDKCKQRVVVIIDEYDKPLLNTIEVPEIHIQLRNELKGFFGVLKSSDAHLQFSFITGVTRFSKVSIFSDLNQLDDISFNPKYADICGITQDELERDFADRLIVFAPPNNLTVQGYREKLRRVYNGYRFSEKSLTVYNPFGIINHFMNEGSFSPWWFESGSPTFLFSLIESQGIDILNLEDMTVSQESFTRFDIENLAALPVLYQSGYLTIKDFFPENGFFKLGYPNEEVSSAFNSQLLQSKYEDNGTMLAVHFPEKLISGEIDDAMRQLQVFLAAVPYDIQVPVERYYQSLLHLVFSIFGFRTRSEVRIATGRIDTLVETKKFVYCFEFKLNTTDAPHKHSAQDALEQIGTKDYMTPWHGTGKQLYKIGVVFSYEKRNIVDWQIENTQS
jgi:hypothetical protein